MNRIRLAVRREAQCLAVAVLLAVCAPAQASSPQVDEAHVWPDVETVQTLLRADAAAALADCRTPGICQTGAAPAGHSASSGPKQDDIRVAAIFGSTRRLTVDVVVNGALLRYRAGHGAPIAGAVSANGYQLLAVVGACVHLRRDEHDHMACVPLGRALP
jgi:hypothetical protein